MEEKGKGGALVVGSNLKRRIRRRDLQEKRGRSWQASLKEDGDLQEMQSALSRKTTCLNSAHCTKVAAHPGLSRSSGPEFCSSVIEELRGRSYENILNIVIANFQLHLYVKTQQGDCCGH